MGLLFCTKVSLDYRIVLAVSDDPIEGKGPPAPAVNRPEGWDCSGMEDGLLQVAGMSSLGYFAVGEKP